MHTLGWWFWRDTPWTVAPPGYSPDYGIEFAGSIALSDSLPLFAFPLKLLKPLLPPIQQYWGAWLLLSMMLQALFGYLLARALGAGTTLALLTAAIVSFAPPFLYRAQDHMALAGHWLVLAALWLYAIAPRRAWPWPLLLAIAALVHAYLLAMVLAIFVASIVQRARLRYPQARLAGELVAGAVLTGSAMWAAGFFVIASPDAWGLGIFRLNLLSPIDPDTWSQVFADIPAGYGDYEGFAYLGLGVLALVVIAALSSGLGPLRAAVTARWLPLGVVLVLLLLFALGPDIAAGPFELVRLPLPPWLERLWSIFRSTGRMAWPAYYLAVVAVVVLVGRRFAPAVAVPLVLLAFLVQLVDTYPGWSAYLEKRREIGMQWSTPFVSAFWDLAPTRYRRVREIPVRDIGRGWFQLSTLAVTRGMQTDSVYMGRLDHRIWRQMDARALAAVTTGSFDPTAIYFIDRAYARWTARQARPEDIFGVIDGALVFARGGADLLARSGTRPGGYDPAAPVLEPGVRFDLLGGDDARTYLTGEWQADWRGGMIAVEQRAGIQFRAPGLGPGAVLRLRLRGNTRAAGVPQRVAFSVNGGIPQKLTIADGAEALVDVALRGHPDGNYLVDLQIAEAEGPFILHPSRDLAPVGLVLLGMELVPAN